MQARQKNAPQADELKVRHHTQVQYTNEWSAMRHIEFLRQQWYRCPHNAVGVSTAGNVNFRQRSFGIKHVVFLRVIFHFFTKTWRRKLGSSPSAMSDVTAVCSRGMLGAVVRVTAGVGNLHSWIGDFPLLNEILLVCFNPFRIRCSIGKLEIGF